MPKQKASFWSRVDIQAAKCWTWLGGKNPAGYGHYDLGRINGKRVRAMAHRVAYELATGTPVPPDMQIDHLCKNPSCVNPDHLEVVTPRENGMRSTNVGATNAGKTHCIRGHELPPKNASGKRRCGQCRSARRRSRAVAA